MTDPGATDSTTQKDKAHQGAGAQAEASGAGELYGRAGTVTFFTLLSRFLGMARDLVIANRFGAGAATDAWVQAFRIPNALRRLTAEGSMTIAFVPVYVQARYNLGPEGAREFGRRVLALVLMVTLALSALGMLLSWPLTHLFSPGFVPFPEKFQLAADLLRWSFPYLALVSLVAWAMGVLNSEGRFAAPAAAPILLNLGIIAAVLLLAGGMETPIMSVAVGVLVGGVAQVLLQLRPLRAVGQSVVPLPRFNDPYLKKLFALLAPALFGVAVYELNIIVLGIIASYLPTGQIFHYNNATRLTEVAMGVFTFAFTTAGLPTLSEQHARKDWAAMADTLRLTFAATGYALLPAMAGLVAVGPAVVAMLYLHGAFTLADVQSTAGTLMLLALGMPAVAAVRVMVPAYYAVGDARTPVLVSAMTLVVTGALGWWLSQSHQVYGLAAGLSLGTWFQCVALGLRLRARLTHLPRWLPWGAWLRQGGAAALMAAVVYPGLPLGAWHLGPGHAANWAPLALLVLGGALVYFLTTLALREREAYHWMALAGRLARKITGRNPGSRG